LFAHVTDIGNAHFACGKINVATNGAVNATNIQYQHIIDENPNIIVTTEVERHILIIDFTIGRLNKFKIDLHSKKIISVLSYLRIVIDSIKGHKPAVLSFIRHSSGIIYNKIVVPGISEIAVFSFYRSNA